MVYQDFVELRRLLQVANKERTKRISMHDGKEKFMSHTIAEKAAKRCAMRQGINARAYRCQFCDGYHVGVRSTFWGRKV